jgi:hypothetical protein
MGDELNKKDVRRTVAEKQSRLIRLRFADVLGFLESFASIPGEFEKGL